MMSEATLSFQDLQVYQWAFDLQQQIFQATKDFPQEETHSLTDRMRRSSRLIGANIAEAWKKRRYQADFVSKLSDADSQQAETQHWVITACTCGYISVTEQISMLAQCEEIGRRLGELMYERNESCQSWRGEGSNQ
jgi:four helix bundle protein